jgi:hypothetical protein
MPIANVAELRARYKLDADSDEDEDDALDPAAKALATAAAKALATAAFDRELRITTLEITQWQELDRRWKRQQAAKLKLKLYLQDLLPITSRWRELLHGDQAGFNAADPADTIQKIHDYLLANIDRSAERESCINELRESSFQYEDPHSFFQFCAQFASTLAFIGEFSDPIADYEAANWFIAAIDRCKELRLIPAYATIKYMYLKDRIHEDRTVASYRDEMHPLIREIPAHRTVDRRYAHFAYSDLHTEDSDNSTSPDTDKIVRHADESPPDAAYALRGPGRPSALKQPARNGPPPATKPPPANPLATPGLGASITLTASSAAQLQPLLQQLARQQPRFAPGAAPPRGQVASSGPKTNYCYSCGQNDGSTGVAMHNSKACPAHLRKKDHNEAATYKNWRDFPNAAEGPNLRRDQRR